MRYTSFKISLFLLATLILFPVATLAHGDGYTDCERDPVYERNFTAKPTLHLNLRSRACMTDSQVLKVLNPTEDYKVIAETDGWYKVQMSDGTTGWAGSRLMKATSSNTVNTKLTKEALKVKEVKPELYKKEEVVSDTEKAKVKNRVKGYILLQVEDAGQAYYVNPEDEQGYYMKDGNSAYDMMRSFGLGVSNTDMDKILNKDYYLTERLKGRIVLAVHRNGEAYYIHPKDRSVHYLKNGNEAYKLMRNLSLGISNKDINKLTLKNKVKEVKAKIQEKKKEENTGTTDGTITLSATESDGTVNLNWSLDFTSSKGFKVVYSENENPVYPGNQYHYYSDVNKRSDSWSGFQTGKTYHFRVCEYLGGKCGVYSNDVAVTIEGEEVDESNGAITLSAVSQNGKVYLDWEVSDLYSEKGFKVVYSENPNPVYPGNQYHYYSNEDKRSDTWTGLTLGNTYNFRVCEYLGGSCGIYSNNVALTIE